MVGDGEIKHALVIDFNTFIYDHSLHRGRKNVCHYCLPAFIIEEILKRHVQYCYKINSQTVKMAKKDEYVKSKIFERKINSKFIIYADFWSILVPEGNGKQNPNESYTEKYQKHIACSYGYKLVCADDNFS